ncbi:MAG: beta-ketoacyl-[acyl-carrier-protein] synthase family protein [Planctomycetaceae bacterium]|nr:beta-ketoacyl-[acyl-carrier-protein] synthase family protein [Planctomycetaceae bacterium]
MSQSNDNSTRVVVTGQGLVTPLGRNTPDIHSRWMSGRSAAATISKFDASNLPVSIGCEVADFEPRQEIRNRKLLRLLMRGEDFGVVASASAFADAGLSNEDYDPARAGIAIGVRKEGFCHSNFNDALEVCTGGGTIDRALFMEEGMRRIPPQTIIEGLANAGLYHIAHEHVLQGVNHNLLCLGTGGFHAIGEAMWSLRNDEADLILAGAFDSWILWTGIAHEHYTGVLSSSTDDPSTVHRPFDVTRTGSVVGEGAALFVLETLERALQRGANVLGEILGFGAATGVPSFDPHGCAAAVTACVRRALDVANLTPADIDLMHLHGDATEQGDRIEVQGLQAALGERACTIPATTIKSTTGFMANASSSVETAAVLEVLRTGIIPPIANLTTPDPAFDLNFVREPLDGQPLRHALLIERSWPSHYAALIVGTPDDQR